MRGFKKKKRQKKGRMKKTERENREIHPNEKKKNRG
jgi:hypothetical protein